MSFCGYLRQNTAVDVLLGPFVNDTDGKTAETGLTLDVEVSKNGQALANKSNATPPVHDAAGDVDGYYNCELNATDTGTLGILSVVAHAAGFLPVHHTYQIVTANWWNTMNSTGQLDVNVTKIEGSDPTDQIRDSVVDDTTKIKGGQLNTHSEITAESITNDWETQSQASPTGFHVNVKKVNGATQTANDNGADINAILLDTGTDGVVVSTAAITAIWGKAMSDIEQGAPSATASVLTAINYLYEVLRNKSTTTENLHTIFKDNGTTALMKTVIGDDATTFTKDKFLTGA